MRGPAPDSKGSFYASSKALDPSTFESSATAARLRQRTGSAGAADASKARGPQASDYIRKAFGTYEPPAEGEAPRAGSQRKEAKGKATETYQPGPLPAVSHFKRCARRSPPPSPRHARTPAAELTRPPLQAPPDPVTASAGRGRGAAPP